MLASVLAAGDTEAKLKVKALQQLATKVVPLDHPEVVDGNVTNSELHSMDQQGMTEQNKIHN